MTDLVIPCWKLGFFPNWRGKRGFGNASVLLDRQTAWRFLPNELSGGTTDALRRAGPAIFSRWYKFECAQTMDDFHDIKTLYHLNFHSLPILYFLCFHSSVLGQFYHSCVALVRVVFIRSVKVELHACFLSSHCIAHLCI